MGDAAMTDAWNPEQYDRFLDERRQPFKDLLGLVRRRPEPRVLDLGCGTGEPTRDAHRLLEAWETLGLDSSPAMLAKARAHEENGLRFSLGDIRDELPAGPFDVVFSNAALHWVDDHPTLFGRLVSLLGEHGQLAVQMPANHRHPSHLVAAEVAGEAPFQEALAGFVLRSPVLEPEEYTRILFDLGLRDVRVFLRVYLHVLASAEDVVEWVKGTTLTAYESRLSPEAYAAFLVRYRELLLARLETRRPYPFTFRRVFLSAFKAPV
jgi:trans-aconitate 2-methyltransferase